MNEKRILPGEPVSDVDCEDVLRSAGVQLALWANDIAFTDAVYGENWAFETANRMASLSEILWALYKSLTPWILALPVEMPDGMSGRWEINPFQERESEMSESDDPDTSASNWGDKSSIDDLPF